MFEPKSTKFQGTSKSIGLNDQCFFATFFTIFLFKMSQGKGIVYN